MNKISSEDFAKMEMLLGQIPDEKVAYVGDQVMNAIDKVARAAGLLPHDDRKQVRCVTCHMLVVGDRMRFEGLLNDYVVTEICNDHSITIDRLVDDVSRYGNGYASILKADSAKPTVNRPYYQRGRW